MVLNIISFVVGIFLLGFGIYQDIDWRRKIANWKKIQGRVVESASTIKGISHRIKFRYRGKAIKFVASVKYSFRSPIGKTVTVLYDSKSGSAVLLCWHARWMGTLICFFYGAGFIYGSIYL